MKKKLIGLVAICTATLFMPAMVKAQNKADNDCKKAKAAFIKTDAAMKDLFANSYGYAIFPQVTKAALIVGGAGAAGEVYEKGKQIGTAKMAQVSIGAQVGGQAYREVIFFENKEAMDRFKGDNYEFSSQVSAVAAKSGVSANAKYREGVQVYTEEINGLMAEASIGGQKFNYKPL